MSAFYSKLFYGWMGWKKNVTIELPEKCILAIAPHTSNWDFVIGQLYARAEGLKSNFLMKKEWFFWPLGSYFRALGGIPVFRSKKTSMTDQLAETSSKSDTFRLAITPEGTRSAVKDWKMGFYYIALKAGIPIVLFGIDFETRTIHCTKMIIPDGRVEEQMREIRDYYSPFKGRHPEKFIL